jgi:hypothetical protein
MAWAIATSIDRKSCEIRAVATGWLDLSPAQAHAALCCPGSDCFGITGLCNERVGPRPGPPGTKMRRARPTRPVRPPPSAPPRPSEGAPIFRVERRTPRPGGAALEEDVLIAAPLRVLFWKRVARTLVRQRAAPSQGGGGVVVCFELLQSVRPRAACICDAGTSFARARCGRPLQSAARPGLSRRQERRRLPAAASRWLKRPAKVSDPFTPAYPSKTPRT